jgi:hypothetical protein
MPVYDITFGNVLIFIYIGTLIALCDSVFTGIVLERKLKLPGSQASSVIE